MGISCSDSAVCGHKRFAVQGFVNMSTHRELNMNQQAIVCSCKVVHANMSFLVRTSYGKASRPLRRQNKAIFWEESVRECSRTSVLLPLSAPS